MHKTQPAWSLLILFVLAAVLYAADQGRPTEPRQVIGFGPDRVRLIEASPFKDRQELHRTVYLHDLDPDRLLAPFFYNAKLPWDAKRYPGWDSGFIEGHMGGHYLSAASRMYAATGDSSYKAKVDPTFRRSRRGFPAGFGEPGDEAGRRPDAARGATD